MKYVFLLGKQSQDFSDLNCLATNLISTFWMAYYGTYQRDLPPEVAKQFNGRKGLHYNLEPLNIPAEIIPIYSDGQLVLIVQFYSAPKDIGNDLMHLISLTKNKDFWNMIIKYDNIASVTSITQNGFTKRSQQLGMDKSVYNQVVAQHINTQGVTNADMLFVYAEDKIPFGMLNINAEVNYSSNPWIKALEKAINPSFIRMSLGIDTTNDPLTQQSLDQYCRNIRQAIMLMCGCKTIQEISRQSTNINNVEKNSYVSRHKQ